MSSRPEPAIWSRDTLSFTAFFLLIKTWMTNIKDVPMVMVIFSRCVGVQTYGRSRDNQTF